MTQAIHLHLPADLVLDLHVHVGDEELVFMLPRGGSASAASTVAESDLEVMIKRLVKAARSDAPRELYDAMLELGWKPRPAANVATIHWRKDWGSHRVALRQNSKSLTNDATTTNAFSVTYDVEVSDACAAVRGFMAKLDTTYG